MKNAGHFLAPHSFVIDQSRHWEGGTTVPLGTVPGGHGEVEGIPGAVWDGVPAPAGAVPRAGVCVADDGVEPGAPVVVEFPFAVELLGVVDPGAGACVPGVEFDEEPEFVAVEPGAGPLSVGVPGGITHGPLLGLVGAFGLAGCVLPGIPGVVPLCGVVAGVLGV